MKADWYIKRLRAMSRDEIIWRVASARLERSEKNIFKKNVMAVTDTVFYTETAELTIAQEKIPAADPAVLKAMAEKAVLSGTDPKLLAGYSYETYKKDWHAGFQTDSVWPLVYSTELEYRQRDDIGDARTNWELNRHFQFPGLALSYAVTKDPSRLLELGELFWDWNDKNPFMWGISWTSVMEAAIRLINWIYTYKFLSMAAPGGAGKEAGDGAASGTAASGTASSGTAPSGTAPFGGSLGDDRGPAPEELKELKASLMESLRVGIINMANHISNHFSRYSSANNHTIVEAVALGIVGIVTDHQPWQELSTALLCQELQDQNYSDGVNKEQALHYQSFVMEALGLLALFHIHNKINVPMLWRGTLIRLSRYLTHCLGSHGECLAFGDDDEGRILYLGQEIKKESSQAMEASQVTTQDAGQLPSHYARILGLMGCILPESYEGAALGFTLKCLVSEELLEAMEKKPRFTPKAGAKTFKEGGITIFRGGDRKVLAAFDHGPLGYGALAAHGHADALSFQLYRNGRPVFGDPGTYIYHIDRGSRDLFRSTKLHNTVTIMDRDQSEILGAFLWGRKAECRITDWDEKGLFTEAEHNGYYPMIHKRRVSFDGNDGFIIRDRLVNIPESEYGIPFELSFILAPGLSVDIDEEGCIIKEGTEALAKLLPQCEEEIYIYRELIPYSTSYGEKTTAVRLAVRGSAYEDINLMTKIKIL